MDSFTIKKFKPGRVLDGHVHDLLGVPVGIPGQDERDSGMIPNGVPG